jgi:hypothetical protein
LPMASMSPDLNLRAAIPIKRGVEAIIGMALLHRIWSNAVHGVQRHGLGSHRKLQSLLPGEQQVRGPLGRAPVPFRHSPL